MSGSGTDWLPYPGTGSGGSGQGSGASQVPLTQAELGASFGIPQLDANALVRPANLNLGAASNKGFSMQLLSDSRGQNGTQYAPNDPTFPGISKGFQSPISWAEVYSGGRLSWDPATGPYVPGNVVGAIIGWKIINGGSGYTAPTLSVPLAVGHVAKLGVTNGVITSVNVVTPGLKPTSEVLKGQNYTVVDSANSNGSGAVLTVVLNGSGAYAVAGCQLDEMLARLPDIINQVYAPKPHILAIYGGTNGFPAVVAGTTSLRKQLALAMQIIQETSNAGIHPIWIAENPKSSQAYGVGTTAGAQAALVNDAFIRGLHLMQEMDAGLNPFQIAFDLVDMSRYQIDGSIVSGSQVGSPKTGITGDGLHITPWGAQLEGYAIEKTLRPFYAVQSSANYSTLQYDPVFNPLGNLIPPFSGTNGQITAPVTGTAPAGWDIGMTDGVSGTGTVVAAISTPTDLAPNADGTVLPTWTWTLNLANNGSAVGEVFGIFHINVANLHVGDVIKISGEVTTSGITNMTGIGVAIQDGSVVSKYQLESGAYMAPATDSLVGAIPPKDAVNPSRFSVKWTVTQATITAAAISAQLILAFDASAAPTTSLWGVTPGVVGSCTWKDIQVTKISSALIQ